MSTRKAYACVCGVFMANTGIPGTFYCCRSRNYDANMLTAAHVDRSIVWICTSSTSQYRYTDCSCSSGFRVGESGYRDRSTILLKIDPTSSIWLPNNIKTAIVLYEPIREYRTRYICRNEEEKEHSRNRKTRNRDIEIVRSGRGANERRTTTTNDRSIYPPCEGVHESTRLLALFLYADKWWVMNK